MSTPTLTNASSLEVQPTVESAPTTLSTLTGDVAVTTSEAQPYRLPPLAGSDLSDFLQRPVRIASTTLASTDVALSGITSFDPWSLFLGNTAVARKTANFVYVRGSIQVIAIVSVPRGAYGRYVISCVPNGGPGVGPIVHNVQSCLAGDYSQMLDLDEPDDMAFQLPFVWQYQYAKISGTESLGGMWTVNVYCLAPVATAIDGGVASVNIRWFANLMPDYEMSGAQFQSRKLVANQALKEMAPKLYSTIGEGKGSAMVGKMAHLAELASMVPVIGPMAATVGAAGRIAEAGLAWFGFTRETAESAPQPTIARACTNLSHVDGQDTSDYASLTMMSEVSIDSRLVGGREEDILANASFDMRWVLVGQCTWTAANPTGTTLEQMAVSPMVGLVTGGKFVPTAAGYRGLSFGAWRGDMEYLLCIPRSSFQRGSIQVTWMPRGSTGYTGDPTNIVRNIIHNIEDGDLQFTVGFASDRPYLGTQFMDMTGILSTDNYNGLLNIDVLNPLLSQTAVSSITMSLFARAKNMDFQRPIEVVSSVNGGGITSSDLTVDVTFQGKTRYVDFIPSAEEPTDKLYWGERILSMRAMMQKPTRITAQAALSGVNIPCPAPLPNGGSSYFTHASHLTAPFVGVASSERYKVFIDGLTGGPPLVAFTKTTTGERLITQIPNLATVQSASNGCAEASLPYYTPRGYVFPRNNGFASTGNPDFARLSLVRGTADWAIYYSYGPDIRIAEFKTIPAITFASAGTATKFFTT